MKSETIAAIATPAGKGGIAIIRISGEGAFGILQQLFSHQGTMQPRKMYFGSIVHKGVLLDQCLCVCFEKNASFTGEPVAEIHCHGGYSAAQDILNAVLEQGARLAENGEFTRRAFLNGKLELSQAEAIGDMIDAESQSASRAAAHILSGELGAKIKGYQDKIKELLTAIEAGIDYPEEIEEELTRSEVIEQLEALIPEIDALLDSYARGRITKNGLMVCLAGPPNAGKSSLLNALCGYDRAIVTPIAGTTRDILHEIINMDGLAVHLYDTAGLREGENIIEKAGVDRSFAQLEKSDVILYMLDASQPFSHENAERLGTLKNKTGAVLLNKSDLTGVLNENLPKGITHWKTISISALTGEGLDEIVAFLKEQAAASNTASALAITSQRHFQALKNAKIAFENALKACEDMPIDCVSIDLTEGWQALGEITGESVSEEIVNNIFAKFCVGK